MLAATFASLANMAHSTAQEPGLRAASPGLPVTEIRTVGLGIVHGELLGSGPDYKVVFGDEVVMTPALGAAAPHNLPLGYRLEGVGRGDSIAPVPAAAAQVGEHRVVYEHGVATSRYTLRADGVEQDFLFTQLPPGRGDLVVRGRVRTELPLAHLAADRIDFAIDGIGGVRIGAVVGVDAAGRRAAGELRLCGDVLEYRLPAAFVDGAALPLVVDPLLGTITGITTINADSTPDVAYDVGTDTWLIVWSREFSASNSDIRGQRVLGSGVLQGGLLSIESGATTYAERPSVANVAMRDAFVVAWSNTGSGTSPGVHARGVSSASGAMTPSVVVRSGTAFRAPQLSGEASETVDDDVLCFWNDALANDLEWCQLSFTISSTIGVFGTAVFPAPGARDVALTPTGGAEGRHLAMWIDPYLLGTHVSCALVDRNQNVLGGALNVAIASGTSTSANRDEFRWLATDGGGSTWTLAWERLSFVSFIPASSHVDTAVVAWSNGELAVSDEASVPQQSATFNGRTSVCRVRDSSLLAWEAGTDLHLVSLDAMHCEVCEGSFAVDTSPNSVESSAMSHRGGPAAGDGEALLVWSASNPGGQIRFVRFRADDGTIDTVAAACDGGGRLAASCAFPSHPMRLQLTDAPPNAPSLLVFSLDRLDYGCGSCTLVPDPFAGFVTGFATTDAVGMRHFELGLPSSASGRRFYAQFATAGTGCLSGFSLSSAISIRIQ